MTKLGKQILIGLIVLILIGMVFVAVMIWQGNNQKNEPNLDYLDYVCSNLTIAKYPDITAEEIDELNFLITSTKNEVKLEEKDVQNLSTTSKEAFIFYFDCAAHLNETLTQVYREINVVGD